MFPDLFPQDHVKVAIECVKGNPYYKEHGFDFDAYILTDQGVRANQIAIEASGYEVVTS